MKERARQKRVCHAMHIYIHAGIHVDGYRTSHFISLAIFQIYKTNHLQPILRQSPSGIFSSFKSRTQSVKSWTEKKGTILRKFYSLIYCHVMQLLLLRHKVAASSRTLAEVEFNKRMSPSILCGPMYFIRGKQITWGI